MTHMPAARRFRLVSSSFLVAILCLFHLLPSQAQTAPVAPASAQQAAPISSPSVAQELEALAGALRSTQQQVEQSREQIQRMQAEIDRLRSQLAVGDGAAQPPAAAVAAGSPPAAAPAAEAARRTSEDLDMLRSIAAQQQQTKVESSSRLPVRLTGMVLFNAFANRGNVDQIDLPTSAFVASTTGGNASTGASPRQTILGLEGTGPVLGGARTSARVSLDFFGGVTGSASSGPAGTVRLRTAAITAEWAHDTLDFDYDTPLISPLSPESFATVALPSLAWSGNLWTWAPQVQWKHSHPLAGGDRSLSFQLGLLDTQTLNAAGSFINRSTGAGEASGQPSYETRVAFHSGQDERRFDLGVGGLYGRQSYSGNQHVDTWTTSADWRVPLGNRLRVSGELYRGRGLGSLGGGAYRDVVAYLVPGGTATYLRALDAEGGWLEASYRFTSVLHANASIGQDSASRNEILTAVPASGTNPIFFYTQNRSIVGNLVFRPWASILVSPEYRRLQSWPISGSVNTANIYTLSFGYQF